MAGISINELIEKISNEEQGVSQPPVSNNTPEPVQYNNRPQRLNEMFTPSQNNAPAQIQAYEKPIQYPEPNYTLPVSEYTKVNANGTPNNVSEAMEPFQQVNIATQQYADDMQNQIIRDYYNYQNDENYQGMLNRTYTNQTYDYLKRKNKGANDVAWSQPKPEDDLFTNWLPDWIKAQSLERENKARLDAETPTADDRIIQQAYQGTTSEAQRAVMDAKDMEHGNWNLMSWWDKAKYLIVPGSTGYSVDDAPNWAVKVAKNIMPSAMAAGAGSMVGGIVGGIAGSVLPFAGNVIGSAVGAKLGAALFGGATFLQGVTGIEIPVINDVMNGMNFLGDKTEQALGSASTAYQEAKRILGENATTIDLIKTAADVLQDPENKYLWDVSKYSYEVGAGTFIDEVTNGIYNKGVDISNSLFGTNYEHRDIADVNRANIGRSGWEDTVEGTYGGTSLLDTYTPIFTGLVDAAMQQGLTLEQAKDFAFQNMDEYVLNYRGTTGLVNDFIAQSYQDPTNFINYTGAKLAEGIGKVTKDPTLQNAARAAAGNPLIDALDPITQPVVEGILTAIYPDKMRKTAGNIDILKPYGSQGMDAIKGAWQNNLRIQPDALSLKKYQRSIAGIDNEGKISGFEPNRKVLNTGNKLIDGLVNGIANAGRKTEDAKMFEMSEMTTEFVGSLLFEGDAKFHDVPDLVQQITGKVPIGDNSPLKKFENTALMNTLRDGLSNVSDSVITTISDDILKYRSYGTNRAALDAVSEKLHMTPKEILDAIDNRKQGADVPQIKKKGKVNDNIRQDLYKKIRQAGITLELENGRVMDTEAVIKSIDKFKGKRQMYSQTFFKADILEKINRAVDDYNMKRYNIQPDAWWSRMADLTKSMQSIALLNFSPSYIVNNFLNNMITRTVAGAGGVDSDFVKTVNAERGLFYSRGDEVTNAYDNTGKKIQKNKKADDTLQKFSDLFKNATDKKIFKGVNNIDIEGMETRAASDLGMSRYWDATWKHNIPEYPAEWDALGIPDNVKAQIRDIAYDSPNVEKFYERVIGEVNIPGAASVIEKMLNEKYTGKAYDVMKDTISKMPWISEMLGEALKTNDVHRIEDVGTRLRETLTNDINFKNIVQQEGTFNEYRVRFASVGLSAVATAIDVMNDMFDNIWIDQTKTNGTLFLDRIVKNMPKDEFNKKYWQVQQMTTGDYNIARGYAMKIAAAMVEGLGLNDDVSVKVVENTLKRFDIADQQVKQNHEVYQKYGDKESPDYDFKYYRDSRIEMLKKTQEAQLQADIELDAILLNNLKKTLDQSKTGRIEVFEKKQKEVIDAKKKLNAQELRDLEKRLDADGMYERAKISRRQEGPRRKAKEHIDILQREAADILKSLDNSADAANPAVIQPMTADTTLRIMLIVDEAKKGSKNAGEFLEHYVDKSDPKKVFEPIDYKNKNVNNESFRDYAKKSLSPADQILVQEKFDIQNDGVALGWADTTPKTYTTVSDEYKLINPKANLKASEYTQVRCYPMQTSMGIAEAGVYHNGQLIGLITDQMPKVVNARGNGFPVLGVDMNQPSTLLVLVKDKVMKVTVGSPNNAEFTSYAQQNFHPAQPGSTPIAQPWGTASLESSQPMREALFFLEDTAKRELQKSRENGSVLGKLNPQQREAILNWVDTDLRPAYSAQRYQTQKYGDMMVDMSLLNYNSRYGFDTMLTAVMPYQFWLTRSVANWGKRMISQPKWFATYARLEKLIEKNKKDVLPSRLEGLVGMLMPNMGDGLGSALYFDPFGITFPMKQFYETPDYYISNFNTVHNNTLTVIDEYYNEGKPYNGHVITEQEYEDAMEGRGELYEAVLADQRKLDETDTSTVGLVNTFLSLNVLVDALVKKMRGKEDSISYSPMYRLGNTIKATGDQTSFQAVTDMLGGALQIPDKAFRKALGVTTENEMGNFFDYYMTNFITDMYLTHEISYDDMTRAMAEGPGNKVYDEALHRYGQQQAIRQQAGALMTEIGQSVGGNKQTSAGQILGSAIASLFGAKIMSQGEEQYREIRNVKLDVDDDEDLLKKFRQEFPEYGIHNWSYEDDPEERVHKMLVAKTWATYNALPDIQKNRVSEGLGDRFKKLFLDKETRATDYLDDEELGNWIQAMGGNDPTFSEEDINNPMRQAQQIRWYADTPVADYQRFLRDFNKLFPGFDTVQDGYYAIPETNQAERDRYLANNPMLQAGWDYKKAAKRANPAMGVIMDEKSPAYKVGQGEHNDLVSARLATMTDWTKERIKEHVTLGIALPDSARHTAQSIYATSGSPLSFEDWLKATFK